MGGEVRLRYFLTSSTFHASTTLLLVKNGRYLVGYVVGWGIEAMWAFCRTDKDVLVTLAASRTSLLRV